MQKAAGQDALAMRRFAASPAFLSGELHPYQVMRSSGGSRLGLACATARQQLGRVGAAEPPGGACWTARGAQAGHTPHGFEHLATLPARPAPPERPRSPPLPFRCHSAGGPELAVPGLAGRHQPDPRRRGAAPSRPAGQQQKWLLWCCSGGSVLHSTLLPHARCTLSQAGAPRPGPPRHACASLAAEAWIRALTATKGRRPA